VISNIDPARTFAMIEGGPTPRYEQSASCFTIFLGLDVDLGANGFGRFNVWSYPGEDLDAALARTTVEHQCGDPFVFLSTPSLYADPGVLAPAGSSTVQINVASDFEWFATAAREGRTPTRPRASRRRSWPRSSVACSPTSADTVSCRRYGVPSIWPRTWDWSGAACTARDSTSPTASCTGGRSARRSRICTSPARPPGLQGVEQLPREP
jgi:hypothetical protein